MNTTHELVIGLEVHVQLSTATKMFCRCPNRFGAPPNTLICPTCLGYPGTLPVVNPQAVALAVRLALALGARVAEVSEFARKQYCYPDLPKGYQISQYERPLATGGRLPLSRHPGTVTLSRLHLEEDAGKLLHEPPLPKPLPDVAAERTAWVDFNRCGVPLVEIVTAPEIPTPAIAQDFLQSLRQLVQDLAVSDGNMEEGSLRCDANLSLRPRGHALGTRTEIKNLNSFRHLGQALAYEAERHLARLESGQGVQLETRTFAAKTGQTHALRSKGEAEDYRYFPEPDLPRLCLTPTQLALAREHLPELPWARRERLVNTYGLTPDDARLLATTAELTRYFEQAVAVHPQNPLGLAHWIKGDFLHHLREHALPLDAAIAPARLAHLVALVDRGALSHQSAKKVLAALFTSDSTPETLARQLGLLQVREVAQIASWVDRAVAAHPEQARACSAGKTQLLGFFLGQVMQLSSGQADPALTRQLLEQTLCARRSP